MIAAIILAAGASTRLGIPKQLLKLNGETLLDRTIRIAREAGFNQIHVILGANASLIQHTCALKFASVHLNPDWQEGMASSLRVGTKAAKRAVGSLVMTCDMPAVTSAHLRALTATGELTASHYAGRNGVPAFFPPATYPTLLTLTGDTGARYLLRTAHSIPLEHGEVDIDTPADVHLLHNHPMLGQRGSAGAEPS